MEALGIDVGGVIIAKSNDGTDTSFFSNNYLKSTAVEDAVRVITELVERRFGQKTYIVSKCEANTERKTLEWLFYNQFFLATGILPQHVRFCRTREGKAPICQELHITHFVDDRLEVLSHLHTVPHKFLFQANPREVKKFESHLNQVRPVDTWLHLENILL